MFDFQITDIDIKIPCSTFETELRDAVTNVNNDMDCDIKLMSTRVGKQMYKINVHDTNGNGDDVDMCAEKDDVTGDALFHSLKLKSLNESFYKAHVDDSVMGTYNDPLVVLVNALENLCSTHKGKIAYIDYDGNPRLIVNGIKRKVRGLGIVDENGNVFCCTDNAKVIGDSSIGAGFSVNKPINEWLGEHLDLQQQVAVIPDVSGKMNCIGKYLIQAKINDDIDADEFMDIFRQAGIFGFTEPSILNIYKLIM